MKITVHYRWIERNVVPPRCRKPRDIYHDDGVMTVELSETTSAEAPVAFRVPTDPYHDGFDVRWWGGKLWVERDPRFSDQSPALVAEFPRVQYRSYYSTPDEITKSLADLLIIDDVVWRAGEEPRYVVMTYGLGHNHGGTALHVTLAENGNVREDRYFRADQFAEAVAEATDVANHRGDNESVPAIAAQQPIEVLIPEAVRLNLRSGWPIWNVRATVVKLIRAETEAEAIAELTGRLNRAKFDLYEGDSPDAFESEPLDFETRNRL